MVKAIAVVGSAWGDESKGKMVDYFSDENTMVVRYNGSAQAGHTVVRDGICHIFRHFGSGTLMGASTFLSQFFINNPTLFLKELELLKSLDCNPKVFVDEIGMVYVPWDAMINQILEETRGNARHGSCGIGINETMKRDELVSYRVTIDNLKRPDELRDRLKFIQENWIPTRLKQLNLTPSQEWMENLTSIDILDTYIQQCTEFLSYVTVGNVWHKEIFENKNIVFEGAQGLLLDEDHYFFPHVTHSHTGLKNILVLADIIEITELDVIYATRAYATRHGAGPFPREVKDLSYKDETNVPHMFQGVLRFGYLDIDLLKESIENDLKTNPISIDIRHGIAVTCLDQLDEMVEYWYNNMQYTSNWQCMVKKILQAIKADKEISFVSFGPTADDVTSVQDLVPLN